MVLRWVCMGFMFFYSDNLSKHAHSSKNYLSVMLFVSVFLVCEFRFCSHSSLYVRTVRGDNSNDGYHNYSNPKPQNPKPQILLPKTRNSKPKPKHRKHYTLLRLMVSIVHYA